MSEPIVRPATEADLPAINAIYNREILEGTATWDLDPWSPDQRLTWFRAHEDAEPILAADLDGQLVGFAYLSRYRGRRGYRFTRENTVFVHPDHQRRAIGRLLLTALIEGARDLGLRTLLAWIDEDNVGSIRLHRALGYEQIGRESETGYKLGRWRSAVELQLLLDRPAVDDR
jgi:phosphinothricin acetyltransferase